MTTPCVSIIVPCHNGGRFLDGLLASLDAQTFRDFEVIIVDDGSTDAATREKLEILSPAIRVVHQENRYLPAARNRGFLEARAELVLPLDCDDTLEPSYLAETVPILEGAPVEVGFVFTHVRLTDSLTGVLPRHLNRFDQLFLNLLPYCMLIRKSAWRAVGGDNPCVAAWRMNSTFGCRLGFRGIEPPLLFVYSVRPDGMLLSRTTRMHGTIGAEFAPGTSNCIGSRRSCGVAPDAADAVQCLCRNRRRVASFGQVSSGNLVQQPVLLAAPQDPRATHRPRRAADRRDAGEWRSLGSGSVAGGEPGRVWAHRHWGCRPDLSPIGR